MTAAASIPVIQNPLTIQKSYVEYGEELKLLSNCAWQIAYTALWNTQQFSAKETGDAKIFISNFLQQQPGHKMQYAAFVQRVLLARQYISNHPGNYIPIPTQWFSCQNKNGFSGTQKWLTAIQKTRASMPLYKQAISNFPEAVWQTTQTGKPTCFHFWRSYFIQQKANGLLNLYLSTLANYYLSIK